MSRKMPFRPSNEISQTYNDGIVEVFSSDDTAAPGYQPVIKATHKYTVPFSERVLGINRLFLGRQNQVEIKLVLRIPRIGVSTQDLARTHNGKWYRINAVQSVEGVRPPSLDISLVAVEQKVEVIP